MTTEAITYVAICPPASLTENMLARAAVLLHKDQNSTRIMLGASVPRLAAHFPSAAEAESMAAELRSAGLRAFTCFDSELRQPSSALSARQMAFGSEGIAFSSRGEAKLELRARDVFLIIQGVKQTRLETESIQTTKKLNVTATVLSGGIPFFKKVSQKRKDISTSSELFLRLYGRNDPQPRLEIWQRSFDYSFLGIRVAPSSQRNLFLMAEELRRLFPAAIFDDRLTRPIGAETASATGWDVCDVNCRLVYISYCAP
jgi:hypothetical protein